MGKGTLQVSDNHWAVAPATANCTRTQIGLPAVGLCIVRCLLPQSPCKPGRLPEVCISAAHSQALAPTTYLPGEAGLWFTLGDMSKCLFTPGSALTTDRTSPPMSSLANH